MEINTKTTFFRSKLCKVISIILSFAVLVYVSERHAYLLLFLLIFVSAFRTAIKHKKRTGSWPQCAPPLHTTSSSSDNMNPFIPGSAAWHIKRTREG